MYFNLGAFVAERITSKFLFRSDWTLAASGGARMKLHSFRQDLQDYQDFCGLVWLYPVHIACRGEAF